MERDLDDLLIDLDLMIHGILEQAKKLPPNAQEIDRVYCTLNEILLILQK